jgi:hypothetical protein
MIFSFYLMFSHVSFLPLTTLVNHTITFFDSNVQHKKLILCALLSLIIPKDLEMGKNNELIYEFTMSEVI